MALLPVAIAWVAALVAGLLALSVVRHWRIGRVVPVDWIGGLAALPRRYLVDVHHVVARRPEAGRMHALMAGGLLSGMLLLLAGILPWLRTARPYWDLAALCFAVASVGAVLVARRRLPRRPAHLSGGAFLRLPAWLGLASAGGLATSVAIAVPARPVAWLVLAGAVALATGVCGLLAQLQRGPMRHAVAGTLHLLAHPRPARFGGGRDTALRPLDLAAPVLGVATASQFDRTALAGFDACIQCGRCEQACPALAAGQPLNPKALIQDLAAASRRSPPAYAGTPSMPGRDRGPSGPDLPIVGETAPVHPDTLWACTTCRACVEECPMMIEHVDAVIGLRRHQVLVAGALPPAADLPLRELRHAGTPGGQALSARADFAAGLSLPVLGPGDETDILLWLGEGAFDLRHGRVLRALVQLLRLAGQRVAVLGEDEQDCGDLARRLGDEATFQLLARANIAVLQARRFRRIVTADPHALHVLRREYPALGGRFEVLHHTGLLDELVQAGALRLSPQQGPAVAYHDPCYLARYNGETEAPRRLLAAARASIVEMERSGTRAMCCGGGGGAPISDIQGTTRIPDLRMGQAAAVGAAVVAVGCPGCTAMLEGVAGAPAEVRDLAELVLAAVVREPGLAPA